MEINEGEKIKIGDNVEVTFKWYPGQHSVGVCIDAPKDVKVLRIGEVKEKDKKI